MQKVVTEMAFYPGHGMIFNLAGKSRVSERVIMPLSSDGINSDGVLGATDFAPFFVHGIPEVNVDKVERWLPMSAMTNSA
jgi:hypothetical protein